MKFLSKCKGCCGPVPQRYVIVIMAALGLSFVFILRNTFSLALTEMRIQPKDSGKAKANLSEEEAGFVCPEPEVEKGEKQSKGEFDWSQKDLQILIQAYFYGYTASHFPGGILGDFFGAKVVLNSGFLVSGICSLLTPVSARYGGFWVLFFIRIVMGLGHGVIFPALSTLVAKWAPPNERSRMSAITYSGIMFGSASGISAAGYILGTLPGWEPVFYIFGGMMVVWCVAFHFVGFSSPLQHPFMNDEERAMVEQRIAVTAKEKPKSVPWCRIFCSMPYVSFIWINFGHAWLVYFVGVQLPYYIKAVLHFNIKHSGVISALPYLAMWTSGLMIAFFSDYTITHNILSVTNNRKIFAILSNLLPIPFLIGASYAGCDKNIATALFTMMMFFKGFAYSSLKANAVDLSPNYAGLLMGFANGLAALGGLIIPSIVNIFVKKDSASVYDWRKTFFFSAGVMLCFTLPYAFFASGEMQPWNNLEQEGQGRAEAKTPDAAAANK